MNEGEEQAVNENREPRPPAPVQEQASPEALDVPETEIERLTRERDEHLGSWQRAAADYANLRRRVHSDVEAAVQRVQQPLLQDLLLVLDYLDLALASPCDTDEGRRLHAGVEMTRLALMGVLEREGVAPIPDGGRFDAALHQAVERFETSGQPAGEILATVRRGYTRAGQILRPAQVRVAAEPSPAGQADTSPDGRVDTSPAGEVDTET